MNVRDEIKALKDRISELEQQVEQEKEFPQDGDKYHYIEATGRIDWFQWDESSFGLRAQDIGNIYKTNEEAEFAVEKLKVEAELQKFSRPFKEDDYNYFIQIYPSHNDIVIESDDYYQTQGTIYFETTNATLLAIDTVGEYRIKKYIFGVED